jgi:hypothetical protein
MRHRLAIAAALLLALTGCSDDSPGPKASASTTPASASPSPTGPVAPVLPEAAKANTTVGAKAFVRYWFEAVTYAMKTGDTGPIDAVAHKTCGACRKLHKSIDAIYSVGQHTEGGGWNATEISLDPRSKKPSYRFDVKVAQPPQMLVSKTGETLAERGAEQFVFRTGATWQGDQFVIYGLEKLA